jgi:hypothetical protein
MTHPPPNTKSVEVQARQPQDDDLAQRMSEIELALELLVGDEATHDWLRPPHYHGPQDWSRDARNKEVAANLQHINDLCRDGEAYRAERQSGAPPSPPPDGLLTPAERGTTIEAAAILGLKPRKLQAMSQRGEIPGAAKLGRQWTYDLAKLRRFVEQQEQACQNEKPRPAATGAEKFSGARFRLKASGSGGRLGQMIRQSQRRAAKQAKNVH